MTTRHLSSAMIAAEIMRSGRREPESIQVRTIIRRRKRTVQEIRSAMMQASINRERELT